MNVLGMRCNAEFISLPVLAREVQLESDLNSCTYFTLGDSLSKLYLSSPRS
jgi:hypothetical protein